MSDLSLTPSSAHCASGRGNVRMRDVANVEKVRQEVIAMWILFSTEVCYYIYE